MNKLQIALIKWLGGDVVPHKTRPDDPQFAPYQDRPLCWGLLPEEIPEPPEPPPPLLENPWDAAPFKEPWSPPRHPMQDKPAQTTTPLTLRDGLHEDVVTLLEAGYSVVELTTWHYRVEGLVDFWPTTGKWRPQHRGAKTSAGLEWLLQWLKEKAHPKG